VNVLACSEHLKMADTPPATISKDLPPNVYIYRPRTEPTVSTRPYLCWCAELNLQYGVNWEKSTCRTCGKLVYIIDLERFRFVKCLCLQPVSNEFFYCYLCNGVIHNGKDANPPEAIIAYRRALFMRTHNLTAHQ